MVESKHGDPGFMVISNGDDHVGSLSDGFPVPQLPDKCASGDLKPVERGKEKKDTRRLGYLKYAY